MTGWIFVTGTSGGLGREIAKALVAQGQKVWGLDIKPGGGDVTDGCPCDVRDADSVQKALDLFHRMYPYEPISALVNNAAVNQIDWFADLREEDWDRVMDVNAKGIYLMSKALLPDLEERFID